MSMLLLKRVVQQAKEREDKMKKLEKFLPKSIPEETERVVYVRQGSSWVKEVRHKSPPPLAPAPPLGDRYGGSLSSPSSARSPNTRLDFNMFLPELPSSFRGAKTLREVREEHQNYISPWSPRYVKPKPSPRFKDPKRETISLIDSFETANQLNKERIEKATSKQRAKQHWEELKNKMSMRELQLFYLQQSSLLKAFEGITMERIMTIWKQVDQDRKSKKSGVKRGTATASHNTPAALAPLPPATKGAAAKTEVQSCFDYIRTLSPESVALPTEEFDLDTFRRFMNSIIPNHQFTELDYIFQVFDSDKNGDLSFVEFFSSLAVALYHRDKDLNVQYVFHKLDPEQYGKVRKERLYQQETILKMVGSEVKSSKWRRVADHLAAYAQFSLPLMEFAEREYLSLDEFRVMVYSQPSLMDDFEGLIV